MEVDHRLFKSAVGTSHLSTFHFPTSFFNNMRLTIIAPESVYEHEVDPSMEVRDVKALIEAEVSHCRTQSPLT